MATERIDNPFTQRRAQAASPPREAAPAREVAPPRAAAGGASGRDLERALPRAELRLRAMSGYEEEVVESRRRDANTAALCNEIVARCSVAPGADFDAAYQRVRAMSTVDRDAALVRIRILSLGEVVNLDVACPACGHRNEVDFKLSALPLPEGPVPAEVEIGLPDTALPPEPAPRTALARTPNAGDQEDLLSAGLSSESARRTFLLSRVLLRYAGAEGPFDAGFVRALPIAARAAIERAIESAIPDLDLSMAVQCAACSAEFSSPFDVTAFFLPR
ncbi:hypothetical protein [Sorangium sp. So ce1335]|uniref:T4 family baseplate hub assembly chaperone n=1 Tax=Sorangium sp. So ce1335 TaxID=3133335 RepID=UPI003F62187C